jgi:putative ATP-binding cassette transporter
MIRLIVFLFQQCRREMLIVALLGLIAGAASAGLVAVINQALQKTSFGWVIAAAFALAALMKIGSGVLASVMLLEITNSCMLRLCDQLCRRVLAAPFRSVENLGASRILAVLTDDISSLSAAIAEVPYLVVNISILIGCAVYLVLVSWSAALAVLVVVAFGLMCYRPLLTRAHEAFQQARSSRDVLFGHYRSLTEGIKELKLNRQRREIFLSEDIASAIGNMRHYSVRAVKHQIIASGWTQVVFYGLLAILLFALPAAGVITEKSMTAYVFTALFTATPLWATIAALPHLGRGRAALERVESLGTSLDEGQYSSEDEFRTDALNIRFRGVEFAYEEEGNGDFALGPLDLDLNPGEIVFVIGGNGSGKSTFVKVLTGLYTPQAGEIRVNGQRVDLAFQESYRQLFSVVYSDFYLFKRLPGASEIQFETRVQEYLAALQLAHKVQLDGDSLSTIALSQGQRRRLALLAAYLEDRPVYVLDEWASDQDPKYREVFYTQLLPELKRKGKIVIVVTHDDRYFGLGDRFLRLDYGKIRETEAGFTTGTGRPALVETQYRG